MDRFLPPGPLRWNHLARHWRDLGEVLPLMRLALAALLSGSQMPSTGRPSHVVQVR